MLLFLFCFLKFLLIWLHTLLAHRNLLLRQHRYVGFIFIFEDNLKATYQYMVYVYTSVYY